MGQIKNNTYTLYIYEGGIDSPNESTKIGISYNQNTEIDNNGTKLNLSLYGLSFHRKIYEPGCIKAEVLITIVTDEKGSVKIPDIDSLETYFIMKKTALKVSVPIEGSNYTYTLAENYYIHEIHPFYKRSATNTYIYVKLTIRSMDNLMCLNKFSEAYLGRQFRNYIVKEGIKDYGAINLSGSDKLQHLSATVDNGEEEFIQPYLVQYNESFYDFVIRTANRCGEFVYFEDGELHVGINPDKTQTPINVDNFSGITYHNISTGLLNIDDYTHDSVNRNKYDSESENNSNEYTYKVDNQFKEITVKWDKTLSGKDEYKQKVYMWYDSSENEFNNVQTASASGEKYKIYEDSGRSIIIYKDDNNYIKSYLDNWDEASKDDFEKAIKSQKLSDDLCVCDDYIYQKDGENYKKVCLKKDKIDWEKSSEYTFYYARQMSGKEHEAKEPEGKGIYNVSPVEKTEIYPQDKVYNAEVTADEYFMPLFRNQFSDATIGTYLNDNKGEIISHALDTLGRSNFIDMVADNALFISQMVAKAAIVGNSVNEKYNKIIDTWESDSDKMAVPFASKNKDLWTTIEYYHEIKRLEEEQQRQSVCVDMDSEIIFKYTDSKNKKVRSPLKIGDIVTLAGNSKKYIVIEIDMRGDLPWQRKYDGYGSSEPAEYENSSKSRLCFYAVPAATILKDDKEVEMFYPPVLTSGAFRKSDPQHAIVVDSDDPKKLGRVRIRYPWQSNHTEGTDKDDICKDAASPWIRMVTPMATNGGGMFFKPEAGDEVLVNFENGNIERPYVVGTLYSKHVPAPKGDRIIQSRNGHFIKFDDPTDASCLVSPVLPGIKFLKDWHLIPDFELALLDNFLGGITMSDGMGWCAINLSAHERKVDIKSTFGDVSISAFTGITISAPNGNVKIEGKNIDICAGNRLTLMSGKNLKLPFFVDSLGATAAEGARTVVRSLNDVVGSLIDLSNLRAFVEIAMKPINGTLQIHSNSFLLLEAGDCNAEIPVTAYKTRALATKINNKVNPVSNLNSLITSNLSAATNIYQELAYIAASVDREISRCAKEVGKLYNTASRKLAALCVKNNLAGTKTIFKDGWGQIANKSADEFVKDAMDGKVYMKENADLIATIIRLKDKDLLSADWYMKLKLEWNKPGKKVGWKTDFESKVKDAYKAVRALKNYCALMPSLFNNRSIMDDKSIYKLLSDKFKEQLKDDGFEEMDWVKKINDISDGGNINYAYFVDDDFNAKTVDISFDIGYKEGVKIFKRGLLYRILGDSWNSPGNEPINKTDFFKNRNSRISINLDNSTPPKRMATGYDIIANRNNAWAKYASSLKIVEGDEGFFHNLGHSLKQLIDKKALTFSPERDVWRADVEGKILMSDSSDTITIDHKNGNGVSLKSEANMDFIKEEEQENRLYNQLLILGE